MSEFLNSVKVTLLVSVITLLLLVAVFFGLELVFHKSYLASLGNFKPFTEPATQDQAPPKLTEEEYLNLGWAQGGNMPVAGNSYSTNNFAKPDGVVRIGAFGDSFTFGTESAPEVSYPTLLEGLFRGNGFENMEVLNFGVASYGFDQSYLIHEYLAEKFRIDYRIFMPFYFHARDRDNTFIYGNANYAPIHARYIVNSGKLELIKLIGSDRADAAARYNSMLPPWVYTRHEYKTMPFIKAVLPKGRELKFSPFYYRRDMAAEMIEKYKLFTSALVNANPRTVLAVNDATISEVAAGFPDHKIFLQSRTIDAANRSKALNYAPINHLSGNGNFIRASEMFDYLMGHDISLLPVVTLGRGGAMPDALQGSAFAEGGFTQYFTQKYAGNFSTKVPLYSFKNIGVVFDGKPVATIYWLADMAAGNLYDSQKSTAKSILFLGLLADGESAFCELNLNYTKPVTDLELVLIMQDGKTIRGTIGRVFAPSPNAGFLVMSGLDELYESIRELPHVELSPETIFSFQLPQDAPEGSRLAIMAGSDELYSVGAGSSGKPKSRLIMRQAEGQYLDPAKLDPARWNAIELVFEDFNGKKQSWPIIPVRKDYLPVRMEKYAEPVTKALNASDVTLKQYENSRAALLANPYAAGKLGLMFLKEGNKEYAIANMAIAGTAQNQDPEVLFAGGELFKEAGEKEKAMSYFLQAERGGVANPWVYYHIGDLNADKGNLDEAQRYFSKAEITGVKDKWLYFKLGDISDKKENYTSALDYYRKAKAAGMTEPFLDFRISEAEKQTLK